MEITIPHKYNPREEYQLPFLKSNKRFKIAVWHRRGGKSKTVLNDQIRKCLLKKGIYYYILPTYRQAKAVIWEALVNEHIPSEVIEKKNESELTIKYINGSIQKFVGCEDIDKHRGINPIDVVFDEYAEMNEKIWTAIIQPVLRENKGSATFIFTPKGKNHAFRLLQYAKSSDDWFVSVQNVEDTKAIDAKELLKARQEMPEELYMQEFMCSFLEGSGSIFRRVRENLIDDLSDAKPNHNYQIGVDLARHVDWTVISVIDLATHQLVHFERFNQIDWNLQKARIENVALRYNMAPIWLDATGVGDPIVEDLGRMGLNVNPFVFTNTSKKELIEALAVRIEQNKIKYPNIPILIDELESFTYEMLPSGKIRYTAPEGLHDDCVMSLALACHDIGTKQIIEDLPYEVADYEEEFDKYEAL